MQNSFLRSIPPFTLIILLACPIFAAEKESAWESSDLEARNALDRGDLAQARRSAEDAARIAESAFGPKQMKTAVALRRLAEIERLAGASSDSSKTLGRASDVWQTTLGGKSPYLADLKLQIARDRESAGDTAGAETAYAEAVQIRKTYFGARHTAVADALQQLSAIKLKSGRWEDARHDEVEAADILLEALEPGHPRTLKAFEDLALRAAEHSDLTRARGDLQRVLSSASAAARPALKSLAKTWMLSADYAAQDHEAVAAEEAYSRAIELLERAGDDARPERLSALYKLQELYKAAGRMDAAAQTEQRAQDLERETAADKK